MLCDVMATVSTTTPFFNLAAGQEECKSSSKEIRKGEFEQPVGKKMDLACLHHRKALIISKNDVEVLLFVLTGPISSPPPHLPPQPPLCISEVHVNTSDQVKQMDKRQKHYGNTLSPTLNI